MEFFRDSKINFMGVRKIFLGLSFVVFLASLVVLGMGRLKLGIDFSGGTELTVKFREQPDLEQLRTSLSGAGIDHQLQRFGEVEENEVMVKTPVVEGSEEGNQAKVMEALDATLNPDKGGLVDLNQQGREALVSMFVQEDPDQIGSDAAALDDHYRAIAQSIIGLREEDGIIADVAAIRSLEGVSEAVGQLLDEKATLGAYSMIAAENIGPQIGSELRRKGVLAIVFSIVGMLLYIWYRFELRFGLGAIAALVHDVVICLGAFALAGFEANLTTIAAFLTVVGYSVNDSVVIFDRVRENLRRSRREPLEALLNRSLNQTLSRTVLTSGTTFLVVACLFFLGGEVIRGISFVLLLGVIVGTYSSIFIASPVVLIWEHFFGREAKARRVATA